MKIIPYAHQNIDSKDIEEVIKALKSEWLTQGPKVREFELALCKYTGAKYAVAVSNGTAALHLSVLALNIGKGHKVVTSPITFSASANCAVYVGAKPLFVDIDEQTYHIDIEKLRVLLKDSSRRKNIKAVIPVHLMGAVCDIREIRIICSRWGIRVIEDAAHALGSKYAYGNKCFKVGGCDYSDITIFSFHPIKNITTGEGGAVLTNNKQIHERLMRLRHHGIVKKSKKIGWAYDIPEVGFNYRITDFQCALGISQLKKLDNITGVRGKLVETYNRYLSKIKQIKLPYARPFTSPAYHLYVIRVLNNKRDKLYSFLKSRNILTQVNYMPVHLFSFYKQKFSYKPGDFPAAELYSKECLSLPLYVGLSNSQQLRVINSVRDFFENE